MSTDRFIDANRSVWEEWTRTGMTPAFGKLERFRRGEEVLQGFELDEVGDVSGKSLLHLQCHFGMDTLAWARHGASVTGVDFSEEAIDLAHQLRADVGMDAQFVRSDVYRLPEVLDERFDLVYTSFGVLAWLPELDRWARVIDHFLEPGGSFYIADYHPFALVFTETEDIAHPTFTQSYFRADEPMELAGEEGGQRFVIYGWPYTLGGIVSALAAVGLRIEFLHEFPFSESRHLDFLVERHDGTWTLPEGLHGNLPLLFSLRATKPG